MKTAQRILATSLDLFNQHGESSVTSVDIANELDISPGNLYYHFKGKEIIVDALFQLHVSQFNELIDKANTQSLSLEERFYYFYLLLEKIHLFRFFYRSPMDLMEKYPQLRKGILKLTVRLESKLNSVIEQSVEKGELAITPAERQSTVELVSLIMLQSSQYYQIKQRFDDDVQIYNALALLLNLLMPRMTISNDNLEQLQHTIAAQTFTSSD